MNLICYLLCTGILLYLTVYYGSTVLAFLLLCLLLLPAGLWALAGFSAARSQGRLESSTQLWDPSSKTPPTVFLHLTPCRFPLPPITWGVRCSCSLHPAYTQIAFPTQGQAPQRQGYPLPVIMNGCGVYQFTLTRPRGYDYFHLFPLWVRRHKAPLSITVLPTIYPCSIVWQEKELFAHTDYTPKKGTDYSTLFDLRPYAPGDKLNLVHWKLSHKTDQLWVKQGSAPPTAGVVLFANLHLQGHTLMDALFSASLGLCHGLCSHYLCWFEGTAPRRVYITQPDDLYALVNTLFTAQKLPVAIAPESIYQASYPNEPVGVFLQVADSLYANNHQLLPIADFPQNMQGLTIEL